MEYIDVSLDDNDLDFLNNDTKFKAVRGVADATSDGSEDVRLLSKQGPSASSKRPTQPLALSVLAPQLMSAFNTTIANNAKFESVVRILDSMQNVDYDVNIFYSSAIGNFYETSKRVHFRVGLYLNEQKDTILDCRRLKGDSFVMGSFFQNLKAALAKQPDLGVQAVYEEDEDFIMDDEDEDMEAVNEMLGTGHLQLNNDPTLVKHLMNEIQTRDIETQVNDTGLLAHAAELEANAKVIASEGGESLVSMLEGKLMHDNAALVRHSAVLLKELTRMHPEIFTEQTAQVMAKAMGRWAQKPAVLEKKKQKKLQSSKNTVTNLAQGLHSLLQTNLVKSVKLDEDSKLGITKTLLRQPSEVHTEVIQWMDKL